MPFDDHMMISTPALWPGPVCCVKRDSANSPSMENFGFIRQTPHGKAIPRVFTEVGVTYCYDSMDELITAGWIVD